jgi:hypothetical protein
MPAAGPTPEAQRHGEYIQGDSGKLAVWTNARENMLDRLFAAKSIGKVERAAGVCFIETYHAVWGSPSHRDPLDMGPRGGKVHETESAAERFTRNKARLHTILNRVGPRTYSMLVSVCVFNEPLGNGNTTPAITRRMVFKAALRECIVAYGMQDE